VTQSRLQPILQYIHALATNATAAEATDRELLKRFVVMRDEPAFAAILKRHGALVLAVCRGILHNSHDVEDAFQATFFVLARRANAVRWRKSVAGWLYETARRIAMKMRDPSRRIAPSREPEPVAASDPLAELERRELRDLIGQELHRLPETARLPILLCDAQGLSRSEAARQLGWKEGTVAGRLARARVLMQKRLLQRGITLSATALASTLAEDMASAAPSHELVASTSLRIVSPLNGGRGLAALFARTALGTALRRLGTLIFAALAVVGTIAWHRTPADMTTPAGNVGAATLRADRDDTLPPPPGTHRVLIVDKLALPGRQFATAARLLVIEIESGKVLAQRNIDGANTSVAVSPEGLVVSAIFTPPKSGAPGPSRIELYKAADLSRLTAGELLMSIVRNGTHDGVDRLNQLGHGGRTLFIQGTQPAAGDVANACLDLTVISTKPDPQGRYLPIASAARLPRCAGVRFLRVEDYPQIHLWNFNTGWLEVIDFGTSKPIAGLSLVDGLAEHYSTGQGFAISAGGRFAYYVPRRPIAKRTKPNTRNPVPEDRWPIQEGDSPGLLKRIDLKTNPPRIDLQVAAPQSERYRDVVAVSEPAELLCVMEDRVHPNGFTRLPSNRLKIFGTKDLQFKRQLDLPLADCWALETSRAGKYLYALNPEERRLAVIDLATGRTVKVLAGFGTCPFIVLPLQ
jgi:RNA polymerase sigma factor (sigma-70 family)